MSRAAGLRAAGEAPGARGPERTTGVAVLGTGSIGMRHLNVLRTVASVHPLAVPVREARARELTAQGYDAVESLDEAVARGVRCCVVATDTGRHLEDARAAIERGLDVLVEKPMAATAQEAGRLRDAARAAHRALYVGCTLRFSESLNALREALPQAGAVHAVEIACRSYLPAWRPGRPHQASYSARADEGGVLRDLIHEIDYAGWLFRWPAAVEARLTTTGRLGIAAEEQAHVTWETPAGAIVSVSLDYLARPSRRRMTAFGERGTVEWDGVAGTVLMGGDTEAPAQRTYAQGRNEMLRAQAQAFFEACQGRVDPRLATGEDGVRALAVCDAARRSAATRQEERVEYP